MDNSIAFKFVEFNNRRAMRGAEAARVEVSEGGATDLLWMSKRDIKGNIAQFGEHPELVKALAAYN